MRFFSFSFKQATTSTSLEMILVMGKQKNWILLKKYLLTEISFQNILDTTPPSVREEWANRSVNADASEMLDTLSFSFILPSVIYKSNTPSLSSSKVESEWKWFEIFFLISLLTNIVCKLLPKDEWRKTFLKHPHVYFTECFSRTHFKDWVGSVTQWNWWRK